MYCMDWLAPSGVMEMCVCTDVRLFPFHATSASLPDLHQGSWKELIGASSAKRDNSAGGPPDRIAGLVLSEPHFLSVRTEHIARAFIRSACYCPIV